MTCHLGLVIPRKLVECMNGLLHVASEEGIGTVATVDLPQDDGPHQGLHNGV